MRLAQILAVPAGVLSALYKDSWVDLLIRGITFLGCAMPNFWVGLLLMLLLCVRFRVFPVISSAGDFKSLFLSALTLAIAMAACGAILCGISSTPKRNQGRGSKCWKSKI